MNSPASTTRQFRHLLLLGDVGGFSSFHVGDEAMLESNISLLQGLLPDALITVVTHDPDATRDMYGCPAVAAPGFVDVSAERQAELQRIESWLASAIEPAGLLPPALQALRTADLLVISGGGNLCSSWPELILERLAMVRMAKALGVPLLIFGQTIGPFLLDQDAALVAEILCAAEWVGLREANSVALALTLGVPLAKIDYQLDDAVNLVAAPCPSRCSELLTDPRSGPLIALTVHPVFALSSANNWLDCLALELDRVIQETSAHLLFIPHVRAIRDGCDLGDRSVGEALAARLQNPAAITVLDVCTSAETLWLTQQADVVVSTRYHPLVFGLLKQRPCLGLPTDEYTLVKLHGALSHANRQADLLPLCGSRWDGLAERIIPLTHRAQLTPVQSRVWRDELEQYANGRQSRLMALLAHLSDPSIPLSTRPLDQARLIRDMARVVVSPALFSGAAAKEVAMQESLGHWQSTAREAEDYALDLLRTLHAKEAELGALRKALEGARSRW